MNEKAQFIAQSAPLIAIIVAIGVAGWVLTTWLRIKNGYPLENSWGKAIHPTRDTKAEERIAQLTQENEHLRTEMFAIKERLITVERIVTDEGHRLSREIDQLQLTRN